MKIKLIISSLLALSLAACGSNRKVAEQPSNHGEEIGFHHATLLGDFDGYPMWQWFSDFMGGVTFKNYIAPLADGTVCVEDDSHPVLKGVDKTFVLPDDEWATIL